MNKLSTAFYQAVQKGLDAAGFITESDKKAMAYGTIAHAIALTGLVEDGALETAPAEKEAGKKTDNKKATDKKASGKDALKPEAGKGTQAPPEEKEEIPAPTPEAEANTEASTEAETTTEGEVEVVEEWTEEMCALKEESLTKLNAYTAEDAWGEDYVYNTCVPSFFEDATIVGGDHIRPTNIDGFVTYLDQLAAEFAAQEQQ